MDDHKRVSEKSGLFYIRYIKDFYFKLFLFIHLKMRFDNHIGNLLRDFLHENIESSLLREPLLFMFFAFFIKAWIKCIEIFTIKLVCANSQTLSETLIMYDFSSSKKFNWIPYIWIIAES